MQQYFFQFIVFSFFLFQPARARQFNQLDSLKGHAIRVYYSSGHEKRAGSIAGRVEKAMAYHQQLLACKSTVILLVLSAADWSKYTSFPVYGMPHYNDDKTLIVAAEDNAFWKSFIPPVEQLPKDLRRQVETVYKNAEGNLSMQPFFDLLALHELGHAFHFQGGLTMQRKWMGELFANILLHTYIAENEPGSLPALTIFPQMVVAGGSKEFKYTGLKDVHERYNEIGQQYPKNYGWYQCRWHSAAAVIYDAAGKQVCIKLWNALKAQKEILTDEQLVGFLATAAHKSVADVMQNWDRDTVK